ncbi:unnamed protein product [Candidula unifasciata]|uniref:Glyoxylate reductase/hydroxypyruvate reductase n=1 Tax=Candidula unifasciata TaxID=100452 RepID=A0A8S3YXN1_9EUPU|nr:unnamed protein product [Candidula unifasciata]
MFSLRGVGRVLSRSCWKSLEVSRQRLAVVSMSSGARPRVFISRRIPEEGRALLAATCDSVAGVDGILCLLTDTINGELLDAAGPNLKVVSTLSVGYDHIDVKECARRNVKVGYTPGILTAAVAELTSVLLSPGIRAVENGEWGTWKPMWLCGPGLDGATVGIVGFGRIGVTVGRYLKPFGVASFLYHDSFQKPVEASELGAEYASFDELLAKSDFVVACCALTDETRNLFNASAFKKMKNNAVFVNTSRGGIVNQNDLITALQSGQIGAAGLDVTTPEPLPTDSPLLKLDNCIVLPHIASATHKTRAAMAVLAANNLLAGLRGDRLPQEVES